MKKYFLYGMAAALALGITACSNDIEPNVKNDGNVTLRIQLPSEMGTRAAFGDGYQALTLDYAIYDEDNNLIENKQKSFDTTSLSTEVQLNLVSGMGYKIAFFAHNGSDVYSFNAEEKTFTVDYAKMSENYNTVDNDAFYELYVIEKVTGAITDNVTLIRPVAQINWGTDDLEATAVTNENAYGENAAKLTTKVEFNGVYSTFSLLDKTVIGDAETVTLDAKPRPADSTDLKVPAFQVEPEKYKYVSLQYVLTKQESDIIEATLTPLCDGKAMTPVKVTNLPVQPNYRTNIYGSLLTAPANITVTKNDEWGDINVKAPVEVSTASDLASVLKADGSVKLANDITLDEEIYLAKTAPVTIDLNGHKLTTTQDLDIYPGGSVTIVGGEGSAIETEAQNFMYFFDNTTMSISDVEITTNANIPNKASVIFALLGKNIKFSLKNVTLNMNGNQYAMTTNASNPPSGIEIELDNVITGEESIDSPCPWLFNVPVKLTAKDCHFKGAITSFIARGGDYDFTNCKFETTYRGDDHKVSYWRNLCRNINWRDGNTVNQAGFVMGNRTTTNYQYPTNVKMKGCEVKLADNCCPAEGRDKEETLPAVYAYANQGEGLGVTFEYDENCTFNGVLEFASPNIIVNGEAFEGEIENP